MFMKALSLCFVKLERLSFVVRGVWMSAWVDRLVLSAVGFLLLTDSVIVNSLLEHESEYKEFTKTFSLTSSVNICSIETLSMLEASVLDR